MTDLDRVTVTISHDRVQLRISTPYGPTSEAFVSLTRDEALQVASNLEAAHILSSVDSLRAEIDAERARLGVPAYVPASSRSMPPRGMSGALRHGPPSSTWERTRSR